MNVKSSSFSKPMLVNEKIICYFPSEATYYIYNIEMKMYITNFRLRIIPKHHRMEESPLLNSYLNYYDIPLINIYDIRKNKNNFYRYISHRSKRLLYSNDLWKRKKLVMISQIVGISKAFIQYLSYLLNLTSFLPIGRLIMGWNMDVGAQLSVMNDRKMVVCTIRMCRKVKFKFETFKNKQFYIPLLMAIGMYYIQQLCGINMIFFYSYAMYKNIFPNENYVPYAVIVTNFVSAISVLPTVFLIDKVGRRPLIIYSTICMIISMITVVVLNAYMVPSNTDKSNIILAILASIHYTV
ncbi:hypothetical protein A3Q56_02795 [Intoshia linei]|uniref:Major facilitator superfamily (MFS) profile domain-containing protein n=1 Tax=Intoshia linei TaxID=1819745 RepID=A0A177B542_9BILA|nr:hypothetical protein A3Q56_02795 [Intoshia linei]